MFDDWTDVSLHPPVRILVVYNIFTLSPLDFYYDLNLKWAIPSHFFLMFVFTIQLTVNIICQWLD